MFVVTEQSMKSSVAAEITQLLIDAGADVNARDMGEDTVLNYAVSDANHLDAIRLIVEAGADVNAKNKKGYTALLYATYMSTDTEMAKLLLDAGADVNAADNEGNTPLGNASARSQYGQTEMEDLLKEYGATDYGVKAGGE